MDTENREVTIWFCDIHGFTRFAESASVEKIGGMINAFFEMGVDAAFRHEGTLDKYLEDGFLAGFGARIRKEYTVIGDAVNVAHRIQEELAGEDEVVVGPETARCIINNAS